LLNNFRGLTLFCRALGYHNESSSHEGAGIDWDVLYKLIQIEKDALKSNNRYTQTEKDALKSNNRYTQIEKDAL
jgi:hypothetical protein